VNRMLPEYRCERCGDLVLEGLAIFVCRRCARGRYVATGRYMMDVSADETVGRYMMDRLTIPLTGEMAAIEEESVDPDPTTGLVYPHHCRQCKHDWESYDQMEPCPACESSGVDTADGRVPNEIPDEKTVLLDRVTDLERELASSYGHVDRYRRQRTEYRRQRNKLSEQLARHGLVPYTCEDPEEEVGPLLPLKVTPKEDLPPHLQEAIEKLAAVPYRPELHKLAEAGRRGGAAGEKLARHHREQEDKIREALEPLRPPPTGAAEAACEAARISAMRSDAPLPAPEPPSGVSRMSAVKARDPYPTKSASVVLKNTAANEPIFCLVGRDRFAEQVVRIWAVIAEASGVDQEKVADARAVADQIGRWVPKTEPG